MGVALGVADEVEKQVRALVPAESLRSPMRGAPTACRDHRLPTVHAAAPGLVLSIGERRQRVHERGFGSSSSSSGFSSGGFSGGGGGGGGGTGGGAG